MGATSVISGKMMVDVFEEGGWLLYLVNSDSTNLLRLSTVLERVWTKFTMVSIFCRDVCTDCMEV